MRVTPAAATVPVLLVLLTWLSLHSINTDAEMFDRALGALDDFARLESTLQRDVLTARAGMLRNYDPLVLEVNALDDSLVRLRETAADAETAAAIDGLAASIDRQEKLVEQFKSDNALLQNSLAHFGSFSARLVSSERNGPVGPAVGAVSDAMLHLTLDTSATVAGEVESRLDDLSKQPAPSGSADLVQALLAHGRLLQRLLPATDGVLNALLGVPGKPEQEAVRTLVLTRQAVSRAIARRFQFALYGTSVLLLGALIHLGLGLRARALALRRRAELEHAIAGISMRLISAQTHEIGAHVERALAELAACVGADRAYCVMAGTPARVHAWSRAGCACPSGWPDQALSLAVRFGSTGDGIINVPRVSGLPLGVHKEALVTAGVQSWACVAGVGRGGDGAILGFDALRSDIITKSGELGQLRMALDAVVNAVGRDVLERDRSRLETRLQQARRMETVGALASGIAHNFNNILGAILGHTEMAEAQLVSDSPTLRNLDAIRRAGERARDLVDQILTFGRRRDARRRPVSVPALVAESALLLRASLPPGIDLVISAPSRVAVVSGEPAQLQQVILNLCNNAAQAMDGAGRIEIATDVHNVAAPRALSHGELAPGRHVRIAVADTGRGMDEATLARIFEPFFTTRSAGNGLGLATAREIVRELGAAMNVRSALGQGSRFEVWLPSTAAAGSAAGEDTPALPLGRGETVLVVDTDRTRLLGDEEMLAALGYEPVGFTRASEALATCRETPERFDALLVGYLGAATSALDLAGELHAAAPRLPIVLATASADEIAADALLVAGILEVVRRPLISTEIAAALMRGLALPTSPLAALQS
jgi:signal transduction histidine kinase/CheY-like chemotaxis protein